MGETIRRVCASLVRTAAQKIASLFVLGWLCACFACVEEPEPLPLRRFRPTSPPPYHATAKIGPLGGTLALAAGASIALPKGALRSDTWLAIRARRLDTLAPLPPGTEAIARAHSFLPIGQRFARSIALQLVYAEERGQRAIQLLRLDDARDASWERVKVSTSIGVARASTQRFGIYVVVRETASQDASVGE